MTVEQNPNSIANLFRRCADALNGGWDHYVGRIRAADTSQLLRFGLLIWLVGLVFCLLPVLTLFIISALLIKFFMPANSLALPGAGPDDSARQ